MRLFPLLLLPLAACTATATERAASADRTAQREATRAAGLERELSGLTRRATSDCLPLTRQSSTRAYGDTIVYRISRGLKYVTKTTGGCERIGQGDAFITRTTIGRTCRGDIATTFDPVSRFQTGSCAFGDFTEYRK